jgi:hypothetical protein
MVNHGQLCISQVLFPSSYDCDDIYSFQSCPADPNTSERNRFSMYLYAALVSSSTST